MLNPSAASSPRIIDPQEVDAPGVTIIEGLDPSLIPLLGSMSRTLRSLRTRATEDNIEQLLALVMPGNDPVADERRLIEADNALARQRLIQTVACHTNAELAHLAGHASRNASATGSRWKQERRVFAIAFQRQDRFPAFQFLEGRPRPVIADVLAALPAGFSPWQTAFWFVSTNPWLDGRVPAEMLDDAPEVVRAARMEAETVIG